MPPNVLPEESMRRLNDVRKEVWKGGATGLVAGSILGWVGFELSKRVPALRKHHSRNTKFAAVLVCGALFSFIASTVGGQRRVSDIADIFVVGAKPVDSYEVKRQTAIRDRK